MEFAREFHNDNENTFVATRLGASKEDIALQKLEDILAKENISTYDDGKVYVTVNPNDRDAVRDAAKAIQEGAELGK